MIHPRPADVLENLIATLDESVLPRLKDADVLSAATTTRHMIRFVLNQLRHEPASFAAELPKLHDLLAQARTFFEGVDARPALQALDAALAAAERETTVGHEGIAARIGHLREGLHAALRALIEGGAEWSGSSGYTPLREAIRGYLAWQNIEEAKIVAPAFYGQGARR